MPRTKATGRPTNRHRTRHRGISYRARTNGTRQYSIYFKGRYLPVEGGEQEAITKQAELRGKAARGEATVAPTKLTFNEVAEAYITSKHRLRDGTRKTYRSTLDRILTPRFGAMKIGTLTVEHVAAMIRDLERRGLAPTTIQSYLMTLRGVMSYALRRGHIALNPCDLLTRDDRPAAREPRPDHIWNDDEIESLIAAAETLARRPEARYDYVPLIRTALYTGLRLGELLGLQWQDIDIHEGVLNVRRQWLRTGSYGPPKTKAGVRRIPLSSELTKFLATLKLESSQSNDGNLVFAAKNGKPLGHRNVTRRGFEPAAEHAAIDGVSFHDMRHAFASRMIHRGISSTILAKLMGHESSAITEKRYIHLFDQLRTDDAVRQAMGR